MKYSILGKGKNFKKIFSYRDLVAVFPVEPPDFIQWPDAIFGGGDSDDLVVLPLDDLDPVGLYTLIRTATFFCHGLE